MLSSRLPEKSEGPTSTIDGLGADMSRSWDGSIVVPVSESTSETCAKLPMEDYQRVEQPSQEMTEDETFQELATWG